MEYTHPIVGRETPYEDACRHKNMNPLTIEDMTNFPEDQRRYMLAKHRVVTVLDTVKEGDGPLNYDNSNQWKYYPWWNLRAYGNAPAGSGFSVGAVVCDSAGSVVGSRLSTISDEKSRYVAEIMHEDYRILMKE